MRCISSFKKRKIKLSTKKLVCLSSVCIMLVFFSFPAMSKTENTLDTNAAQLIQNYMQENPIDIKQLQESAEEKINALTKLNNEDIQGMLQAPTEINVSIYPVKSLNLTPGIQEEKSTNINLPQPIFIVGDDDQSKAWILKYKNQLTEIHAQGLVVNVDNETAMKNLRQLVSPDLSLYPVSGDALARWLNFQHYPVLISNYLIEY